MVATKQVISQTFKTTAFSLMILGFISYSTTSTASDLDRLVTSMCEAAQTDDRSGMRKKLKSAKIRLKAIYSGVNCGPKGSLLRVATAAGSMEAARFIATKIGKKKLSSAEADGKTIIQWTEGLVAAGDASKQAFVDLYNSKL